MQENNKEQENNDVLEESLDFNKPTFSFIPKGSHEWRQRGPYLVCKSCELEHATWIGMTKIMVGIHEDGQPILKDRTST